jgi:hypothetical protein
MKKCSKCKEEKSYNLFNKNSKKKDGYQNLCISCKKQQDKEYWDIHKDKWIKYYKVDRTNRSEYINKSKEKGCIKCGEKRYWVLDHHHLDPSKKERAVNNSGSISSLKKEIEKCVILCSNCHREFHHLERKDNITIKEYLIVVKDSLTS